jgi:hypothetical protein
MFGSPQGLHEWGQRIGILRRKPVPANRSRYPLDSLGAKVHSQVRIECAEQICQIPEREVFGRCFRAEMKDPSQALGCRWLLAGGRPPAQ